MASLLLRAGNWCKTQCWIRLQIHGLPIIHCSLRWTTHLGSSGIQEWDGLKEMTGASREASYPPTRAACSPVLDQWRILQRDIKTLPEACRHQPRKCVQALPSLSTTCLISWFRTTYFLLLCLQVQFCPPRCSSLFNFCSVACFITWGSGGLSLSHSPCSCQFSNIRLVPTPGYLGEMLPDSSA